MKNIVVSTSKNFKVSGKMPEEINKLLVDEDKNGIPDVVDKAMDTTKTQTVIEINGKKYDSWEEVPESERKVMDSFKNMGNWFKNAEIKKEVTEEPTLEITKKQIASGGTPLISDKIIWLLAGILIAVVAFSLFRL